MKNIHLIYQLALGLGLLVFFSQCDKTPENPVFEPYAETNLDANAGNWKTYVLASGGDVAVPAPTETGSAAYLAELADLKSKMAGASEEQKDLARQWGGNGVLQWQAIARELAARYNVPPNYNADGTYPLPDATNPLAYPRFPFANPPYASRAFALLAVAQYDALVATWKYKFQYNRLAPYKNDASIQSLIPGNDLPSYPSEDAVIAAASREVLKFLFPGEKPLLDEHSTEQKNSRLWAGANVQSDLDAGDSLGAAVAKRIIAYAKTDKMGAANNQPGFPDLRADATVRGITSQWSSLEIPVRPPMLPFYGRVKTWNFDENTKITLRPAAPPAVGSAELEKDLNELRDLNKSRTREQFRTAAFWADGVGTYTPPGHWNRKAADLIYEAQYNEIRSARAMALVTTAIADAGVSCWDIKYFYLLPRPTQVDSKISTCTGIPNFPSYPSGHSTFSGAAADVLGYLFPAHASDLQSMAKEASDSRVFGCIHYRFDCTDGLDVGKKVGDFAITRGRNDGSE